MKIKKLNASFGNLKNSELTLKEGLNIIEAPNESGKSTWCAFIRTMLYGINTSDRDKIGHLSDKNKYMPWDGSPMEGTMELTYGGKDITLERTAQGAAPMKKLTATYSDTGELVPGMYTDTAGEALTGVPEAVFERTAFIRQDGMRLNQTAELEKRISAIVTSGDEHTSYTEADEKLRKWLRKRRFKRSGTIPQMEDELKKVSKTMERIVELNDELAGQRALEEKLKKQRVSYEEDLIVHEKLDIRNEKLRVLKTESDLEAAKGELSALKDKLVINGHAVTMDDVADVKAEYKTLETFGQAKDAAEENLANEKKALEEISAKKKASKLSSMTMEEIQLKAAEIEVGKKTTEEALAKKGKGYILPIILMILAVGAAVCSLGFFEIPGIVEVGTMFLPGLIGAGAVLLLGFILLLVNSAKGKKTQKHVTGVISGMGFNSSEDFMKEAEEFKALCDEEEAKKADIASAEKTLESAEETVKQAEEKIIEKAKVLDPYADGLLDVLEAIAKTEELLDNVAKTDAKVMTLSGIYNTLMEKQGGKVEIPNEHLPKPVRDRAGTEAILKKTQMNLLDTAKQISLLQGEINALGDPAVISSRKKRLEDEIKKQTEECDALELAISALSEANDEIRAKFSPRISNDASEIMEKLTKGRYEKLKFDHNFDAAAKRAGDSVSRSILSMSGGTADQIYLALRMAMCGLILGGDEPCPMILDDAFVNFDGERLVNALELLKDIAEKRQVIVFTCHEREGKYFAGQDAVNIIKL